MSFEVVRKAQGARADHAAMLDHVVKRRRAMLQQLTHQVSLPGDTLETNVFASVKRPQKESNEIRYVIERDSIPVVPYKNK